MVYGFWDLVILFFKKTKSSSQELNEEKLRKERPRVKLVLRSKIVMSPGFSNPKWSNWCTFYPFLTPNMTVKSQKWLKWIRMQKTAWKLIHLPLKIEWFLPKWDVIEKKVYVLGCFFALWRFGGQSFTFIACRVDPWLVQTTNQLLIWPILFPI